MGNHIWSVSHPLFFLNLTSFSAARIPLREYSITVDLYRSSTGMTSNYDTVHKVIFMMEIMQVSIPNKKSEKKEVKVCCQHKNML